MEFFAKVFVLLAFTVNLALCGNDDGFCEIDCEGNEFSNNKRLITARKITIVMQLEKQFFSFSFL